jgi:hypothetical protein
MAMRRGGWVAAAGLTTPNRAGALVILAEVWTADFWDLASGLLTR